MRHTHTIEKFKDRHYEKGFTLIEVAIVIMVIGLLLVPALALFNVHRAQEAVEKTQRAVDRSEFFMVGFRSMFGRYPCPSPRDAAPGDPLYGFEDCSAGSGIQTATSTNGALANQDILIGNLPFKQMNMQERDSYDGYGNRLTYAVTDILTDENTFDVQSAGISIIDSAGNDILGSGNYAPFVVVSHGGDARGAVSRQGGVIGICANGNSDEENCDGDEVFMKSNVRADYDDVLIHDTERLVEPWRYTGPTSNHVMLYDASGFGIGVDDPVALSSASNLMVMESLVGDGVIYSAGDVFLSSALCDYGDTGCFAPRLIGGLDALGGGMKCGANEFLVGIENGAPVCQTQIVFECPSGEFFEGLDSDGQLLCSGAPNPPCADQTVTTSCGTAGETLTGVADSLYSTVEDGTCHMLDTFSSATTATLTNPAAVQTYVDSLNAGPRTAGTCSSKNLVRDSYECQSGTFVLKKSHEVGRFSGNPSNFPSNKNSGSQIAVTTGPSYNLTASHTANDCWCREDYRLNVLPCPAGSTGDGIVVVEEHKCPQTRNQWVEVYRDETSFCTCAPQTEVETEDCDDYYSVPSGSMDGVVEKTFNHTCDASGNRVWDTSPTIDTSQCTCPFKPDNELTNDCPLGTTNSFSYGGNAYSDVEEIFNEEWYCPNGDNNTVSSASDYGRYLPPVLVHGPVACSCDSSLTDTETKPCPTGFDGSGLLYEKEWDCTIPGWEPEALWDLIDDSQCKPCTWKKPSGASADRAENSLGDPWGSGGCTCGDVDFCHDQLGPETFDNYTNCRCEP